MAEVDFYELLEVERTADEKTIKSSYRRLAMECHPDRNPGCEKSEAKFKAISVAYDVLKDPQKRAAYDRYGHAAFQNGGGGAGAQGFEGFADIFENIFGEFMGAGRGGGRGGSTVQRGADLRYDLEITLEEAFHGKTEEVRVDVAAKCETCSGSGAKPGTSAKGCGTCNGHGKVRAQQGFFVIERVCPTCHGKGEVISEPCGACRGEGRYERSKTLEVKIPPGVDEGTRIRMTGEGEAGARGGPSGDLYIFLAVKPHEFFQRDGADLYCKVPISMTTAALGGSFEVTTLDGTQTKVKVTEGTQNGRQFRLKGKGMPVLRQPNIGDLYIQTAVETPQNLTRRQRELLEEFEQLSSKDNSPQSSGFFARMKDFFESFGER